MWVLFFPPFLFVLLYNSSAYNKSPFNNFSHLYFHLSTVIQSQNPYERRYETKSSFTKLSKTAPSTHGHSCWVVVLGCFHIVPLLCHFMDTSWVPVEGKSSVRLICMKYRIIILIIIIISLGEILLLYIANISCTHSRTLACAYMHAGTHTAVSVQVRCISGDQA